MKDRGEHNGNECEKQLETILLSCLCLCAFGLVMIYPVYDDYRFAENNTEILNGSLGLIPPNWRWDNYATGWRASAAWGSGTFSELLYRNRDIHSGDSYQLRLCCLCVCQDHAGRNIWFALMLATMMLSGQIIMIPNISFTIKLGLVPSFVPLVLPHFFGRHFYLPDDAVYGQYPQRLDEAATIDDAANILFLQGLSCLF